MISGIKIYKPDGTLKQEITKETAVQLYDEQNKTNWKLSKSEQQWWKRFKIQEDIGPYQKKGLQPWIKRTYTKRKAQYKIICKICNNQATMMSINAKFCGQKCAGISRRMAAKNLYNKKPEA